MGFFNLSKALEDVKDAFGAKETIVASAKLLGKGVVNAVEYAATKGVDSALKSQSQAVLDNERATEEQKENAAKVKAKVDKRIAAREAKERKNREEEQS